MDGLHVTLRFLGPTDPARLADARAAVEAAAAGVRPFEVGLAGAGAFPDRGPPAGPVAWAGPRPGPSSMP